MVTVRVRRDADLSREQRREKSRELRDEEYAAAARVGAR